MKSILKTLARYGDISELSLFFAEFIATQANQSIDSLLAFSAALVSEANQQGDVCVLLESYQTLALFNSDRSEIGELPVGPDTSHWTEVLLASKCVARPGRVAPLILEDGRLYLYRYWFYENELSRFIHAGLHDLPIPDEAVLKQTLNEFFPHTTSHSHDEQKLAVALTMKRRFAVISGGPGTGKTTTVINILAMLLQQQSDMRVELVAPTGKAAARMMESMRLGMESSAINASLRPGIPVQASTIHRLLGYTRNGFRYTRHHHLPLDCVVIDEASMVDLTLMFHLFDALPNNARVILLGDRDQLASVAAGNVLGDITGQGFEIKYSSKQLKWLNNILDKPGSSLPNSTSDIPMADSVALLTQSYRFDSQSGIGRLAKLVNQGDSSAAIALLQHKNKPSDWPLKWLENDQDELKHAILESVLNRYQAVVGAPSVEEAFNALETCRVLCAVHSGPFGVSEINRRIDESMRAKGWIGSHQNYRGKPVLIESNDYESGLFNGDIGILWHDANNEVRAYFRDFEQGMRSFPITSLPGHGPAWAMTVHKSQGSEFESVWLILPETNQRRALSRELLYTGITRTRKHLTIYASSAAIEIACKNPAQRHSGLAKKLGWLDSHIRPA